MLDRCRGVFASLHAHDVKYVTIGGIAAVVHGSPRVTLDLDILIEATLDNCRQLLSALGDAGFGTAAMISPEELLDYQIVAFKDRVRVDVFTKVPGLRFSTAWKNRETFEYNGQRFHVVSRRDLLRAKRAAGRTKDLKDIEFLSVDPPQDS